LNIYPIERPVTLRSSLVDDQSFAGNPQEDEIKRIDAGKLLFMDDGISKSLPIRSMRKFSDNGILNTPPDKKEGLMARLDSDYLALREEHADSDLLRELSVNKSKTNSKLKSEYMKGTMKND
jgi:hypothetical protein